MNDETIQTIRAASRPGMTFRFAGSDGGKQGYGNVDFDGPAWEVETPEGRFVVPQSVAHNMARADKACAV